MQVQSKSGPVVEAVQWFPNVEIEGIELVPVKIHYSADKASYYISGHGVLAKMWHPVDGEGQCFPFAFWSIKAGRSEPIDVENPLYVRAAKVEGWKVLAEPYGWVARGGGHPVYSEDWVVPTVLGALMVMSDAVFKQTYAVVKS